MDPTDFAAVQSKATHPLDALASAPDNHIVLLENDKVRVLDTKVAPGCRTPIHAHEWPAALYVLSWSDFIRYDPEGNILVDSKAMGLKAEVGAALWSAPIGPHYVQNVGASELRIIAVETKVS
jgi:hypothetical protein